MPRILNVNLPKNKATSIGLTYIKGIGLTRAKIICSKLNISETTKLGDLSKESIKAITYFIDNNYTIGTKLVRKKVNNIKRLIKISSYRGFRHVKGLPCRGQRTHTNAKTSRKFKIKL
jgi:small subunit ribosomal protein S13